MPVRKKINDAKDTEIKNDLLSLKRELFVNFSDIYTIAEDLDDGDEDVDDEDVDDDGIIVDKVKNLLEDHCANKEEAAKIIQKVMKSDFEPSLSYKINSGIKNITKKHNVSFHKIMQIADNINDNEDFEDEDNLVETVTNLLNSGMTVTDLSTIINNIIKRNQK